MSTYIAIDLKSFYASCECRDRGLDALRTNLVVADASRTDKTICLAVTPSLKAYGLSGRSRLFEVVQRVREVNRERARRIGGKPFRGSSSDAVELAADPFLELEYITAVPRMARYLEISEQILHIYHRFIAPEDIHVYSVDEVFMDVTPYLGPYGISAHELAVRMIREVLRETGITATAGIGPNLYLAKIAMDIHAKHVPADSDGVRIAELTEQSYREHLWTHLPLTDFWRVGGGTARKLASYGIHTMGDIARCSLGGPRDYYNPELLYKLFGVNAELLIDHAWGVEPCTIRDIRSYRPENNSLSSGQVLQCPYTSERARIIVREMTDLLVLDLVRKGLVTDQMVLTIGYDRSNLDDPERRKRYKGPVTTDYYGRRVPKHAHGSVNLSGAVSSSEEILRAVTELYDRIIDPDLLVRRVTVEASHVIPEAQAEEERKSGQMSLLTDFRELFEEGPDDGNGAAGGKGASGDRNPGRTKTDPAREKELQKALLSIQEKYGGNAILRGTSYEEGATSRERNQQIGGHKA